MKNASAGAQFNFGLGAAWSGFARADYVYVGEVPVKFLTTGDTLQQDAYDVVNLRLSFQREALAIDLFGRNVSDERAVLVTRDPAVFNSDQFIIRPREVGVELRYSFQ